MRAPAQAVCGSCWGRLPAAQRAALVAARREGRIVDWSGLARAAVAWLKDHGVAAEMARRNGEREG